ncbi:MAG: hypothetical protein ACYCQJ_12470 [Nitrososphaerales archaeon]
MSWYKVTGTSALAKNSSPTPPTAPVQTVSTEEQVYLDFFNGLLPLLRHGENQRMIQALLDDLLGKTILVAPKMDVPILTPEPLTEEFGRLPPVLANDVSPPVILDSLGKYTKIIFNDQLKAKLERDQGYYRVRLDGKILTYGDLYERLGLDAIASVTYRLSN